MGFGRSGERDFEESLEKEVIGDWKSKPENLIPAKFYTICILPSYGINNIIFKG